VDFLDDISYSTQRAAFNPQIRRHGKWHSTATLTEFTVGRAASYLLSTKVPGFMPNIAPIGTARLE
jgi:hypothetical protein